MSGEEPQRNRPRRERSVRYPGVSLAEAIEFVRRMEARGLDGLMAEAIAAGLGFGSIKTNTFSARLSAARQFGLLTLKDEGYGMTPLARGLLHPLDAAHTSRLHREALGSPPLYADLLSRLSERKLPEPAALANLLYHQYQITAAAKESAASALLESLRFAGMLDADGVIRGEGAMGSAVGPAVDAGAPPQVEAPREASPVEAAAAAPGGRRVARGEARIDLRLWGEDAGKVIRVRSPERITPESYERLLQALKLHVRIERAEE